MSSCRRSCSAACRYDFRQGPEQSREDDSLAKCVAQGQERYLCAPGGRGWQSEGHIACHAVCLSALRGEVCNCTSSFTVYVSDLQQLFRSFSSSPFHNIFVLPLTRARIDLYRSLCPHRLYIISKRFLRYVAAGPRAFIDLRVYACSEHNGHKNTTGTNRKAQELPNTLPWYS